MEAYAYGRLAPASVGSKGEAIAEIAAMKEAGIVAVSDDGNPSRRRNWRGSDGVLPSLNLR